ncbi:hypothetical protein OL230_10280 [Capnocytophaga ochracea]|uniref:hypothetical protein n=1 Tax=Capnocytophaga ochracea TaxID=1018 RepID=UPI00222F9A19|nr:hypothetical protein [Capnocytophaga ochracea]UZD38240.1 hypothetical protein OL230_10280 [Capnocytophaga ochracea]
MKRIYYILKISLFLLFVTITLNSCSKDKDPENPIITDPTEFAWSKLEVRFTKGHSHGYFHGDPDYPVKYLKTVQHFYFENKNGVITPATDNPTAIRWKGTNDQAGISLSGVELIFYDKDGKRVNSLLSTGEAPNHYQFFFIANNFTAVASNTTVPTQAEALRYKYRDTNPEELYIKGGGFDKNPNAPKGELRKEQIGLKGFFEIKRSYVNFDLQIVLGYFATKPTDLAYNTMPTNKIMEVKIPIHIYTDLLAEDKLVEDAVREFGVTREEIIKDQDDIIASDLGGESSGTFL